MSGEKFTIEQMCAAIRAAHGLKSVVAAKLGCNRITVDRYAARYPSVQQALADEREWIVDLAESKMVEAVQDREPWAVALILKTLGRSRGYGDSVELVVRQAETLAKAYGLDAARIIDLAQQRKARTG